MCRGMPRPATLPVMTRALHSRSATTPSSSITLPSARRRLRSTRAEVMAGGVSSRSKRSRRTDSSTEGLLAASWSARVPWISRDDHSRRNPAHAAASEVLIHAASPPDINPPSRNCSWVSTGALPPAPPSPTPNPLAAAAAVTAARAAAIAKPNLSTSSRASVASRWYPIAVRSAARLFSSASAHRKYIAATAMVHHSANPSA
mmetsp:Transcript_13852/g.33410  ORF Transcript_13852/g.33410 Transcript_13852/m.33410 type:complete len:203 (+) Transcript_13852:670-1278(+)